MEKNIVRPEDATRSADMSIRAMQQGIVRVDSTFTAHQTGGGVTIYTRVQQADSSIAGLRDHGEAVRRKMEHGGPHEGGLKRERAEPRRERRDVATEAHQMQQSLTQLTASALQSVIEQHTDELDDVEDIIAQAREDAEAGHQEEAEAHMDDAQEKLNKLKRLFGLESVLGSEDAAETWGESAIRGFKEALNAAYRELGTANAERGENIFQALELMLSNAQILNLDLAEAKEKKQSLMDFVNRLTLAAQRGEAYTDEQRQADRGTIQSLGSGVTQFAQRMEQRYAELFLRMSRDLQTQIASAGQQEFVRERMQALQQEVGKILEKITGPEAARRTAQDIGLLAQRYMDIARRMAGIVPGGDAERTQDAQAKADALRGSGPESDLRAKQVGTPEWFGEQARAALAIGNRELANLANAMGNLEKAANEIGQKAADLLPQQLYSGILDLITGKASGEGVTNALRDLENALDARLGVTPGRAVERIAQGIQGIRDRLGSLFAPPTQQAPAAAPPAAAVPVQAPARAAPAAAAPQAAAPQAAVPAQFAPVAQQVERTASEAEAALRSGNTSLAEQLIGRAQTQVDRLSGFFEKAARLVGIGAPPQVSATVRNAAAFIGTENEPRADLVSKAADLLLGNARTLGQPQNQGLLSRIVGFMQRLADPSQTVDIQQEAQAFAQLEREMQGAAATQRTIDSRSLSADKLGVLAEIRNDDACIGIKDRVNTLILNINSLIGRISADPASVSDEEINAINRRIEQVRRMSEALSRLSGSQRREVAKMFAAALDILGSEGSQRSFDLIMLAASRLVENPDAFNEDELRQLARAADIMAHGPDEATRSEGESGFIGVLANKLSAAFQAIQEAGKCSAAAEQIAALGEQAAGYGRDPQGASVQDLSRLFAAAGIAEAMEQTLSRRGLGEDVKEGIGRIFARALGLVSQPGGEDAAKAQADLAQMYARAPEERRAGIESLSSQLPQDRNALASVALYRQMSDALGMVAGLQDTRNLGDNAQEALGIAAAELQADLERMEQTGNIAPQDLIDSEASRLGMLASGPVEGESEEAAQQRESQAAGYLALFSQALNFSYDTTGNFTAQLAQLVNAISQGGAIPVEGVLKQLAGISAGALEQNRLTALGEAAGATGAALRDARLRGSERDQAGSLFRRSMESFRAGDLANGAFYQTSALVYAQSDNESDRGLILLAADEHTPEIGSLSLEQADQMLAIEQARLEYRSQVPESRQDSRINMEAYFDLAALATRSGDAEEAGIILQMATSYAMWAAVDERDLSPDEREQRAREMSDIEAKLGDYGQRREMRAGARIADINTERQDRRLTEETITAPIAAAIVAGTRFMDVLGGASAEENFNSLMELKLNAGLYSLHSQEADYRRRNEEALSSEERSQARYGREERRLQERAEREREHGNEAAAGIYEGYAELVDRGAVEEAVARSNELFGQGTSETEAMIQAQVAAARAEHENNQPEADRLRAEAEAHRAESQRLFNMADALLLGAAELDTSITRTNTRHREDGRFELVVGLRTTMATSQGYLADAMGEVVMAEAPAPEAGAEEVAAAAAPVEAGEEAAKAAPIEGGAQAATEGGAPAPSEAPAPAAVPIEITGAMLAQQAQVGQRLIQEGTQQVEAQRGTQRARDGMIATATHQVHIENLWTAADLNATMIGALRESDLDRANALIIHLVDKGYQAQIGTEDYPSTYWRGMGSPRTIEEAKKVLRALVDAVFASQNVNDMEYMLRELSQITGMSAEVDRIEDREGHQSFDILGNEESYERIVDLAWSEDFSGAQRLINDTVDIMNTGSGIAFTSIRIANDRRANEEWHAGMLQAEESLRAALNQAMGGASLDGVSSEETTNAQGEPSQYPPEMLEAIIRHLPPEQQQGYLDRLYAIRDVVSGNEERRQLLAELEGMTVTDPASGQPTFIGDILQWNNGLFYFNAADYDRGYAKVNYLLDEGRVVGAEDLLQGLQDRTTQRVQVENQDIAAMSETRAQWERMRQGGGYLIADQGEGQRPSDSHVIEGSGMVWQRYGGGALDEFEEGWPPEYTQGEKERHEARQERIDEAVDRLSDSYGESAMDHHRSADLHYAARDALLSGDTEAAAGATQAATAFDAHLREVEAQREVGWQFARMNIEAGQHQLIMADSSEIGRNVQSAINIFGFTSSDHANAAQRRLDLAEAVLESGNMVQAYDLLVTNRPVQVGENEIGFTDALLNCNMGETLTLVGYTDGDIRGELSVQTAYGQIAAAATQSDLATLGVMSDVDLYGTYHGRQRPTITISEWQPQNEEERALLAEIGRQGMLMRGEVESTVFNHDSRWGADAQEEFIIVMGARMGLLGEGIESLGSHNAGEARGQLERSHPFTLNEDGQYVDTEPITRNDIAEMKTWAERYRVATMIGETAAFVVGIAGSTVTGGASLALVVGMSGLQAWRGLEMYHHDRQWTDESGFQFGMGVAGMVLAPAGMIVAPESSIFLGGRVFQTVAGDAELLAPALVRGGFTSLLRGGTVVESEMIAPTLFRGGINFVNAGQGVQGMVLAPRLATGLIHGMGIGMGILGADQFLGQSGAMLDAIERGDMSWIEFAIQGYQTVIQPLAQYGYARWNMNRAGRLGAPPVRSFATQLRDTILFGTPFDTAEMRVAAQVEYQRSEALRALPGDAQVSYGTYMNERAPEIPPERQAEVLAEYGNQYRAAQGRGEPPLSFERFAETNPALYEARYQTYLERSGGIYDFRDLTSGERTYVESRNAGRGPEAAFAEASRAAEGLPATRPGAAAPQAAPHAGAAPAAAEAAPQEAGLTQQERLRQRKEAAAAARAEQAEAQRRDAAERQQRMEFTEAVREGLTEGEGGTQIMHFGDSQVAFSREHVDAATELAYYAEKLVMSPEAERAGIAQSIPSDLRQQAQALSVDSSFIQATQEAHAGEGAEAGSVQAARQDQLTLALIGAKDLPRFSDVPSVTSASMQNEAFVLIDRERAGQMTPEQLRAHAAEDRRVADSMEIAARDTLEICRRLQQRQRTPEETLRIAEVSAEAHATLQAAEAIRTSASLLEAEVQRATGTRPAAVVAEERARSADRARAADFENIVSRSELEAVILAKAGGPDRMPEYITGGEAVREGGIERFETGTVLATIEEEIASMARWGMESDVVILSADKTRLNQLNQLFGERNGDLALDAYREILRLTASRLGGEGATWLIRPSPRGDEVIVVIVAEPGRGRAIRDGLNAELERATAEVFAERSDPAHPRSLAGLSGTLADPQQLVTAAVHASEPIQVRLQDGEVTATYDREGDGSAYITRHRTDPDGTAFETSEFLAPSTTRVDDPPYAAEIGQSLGIEEAHDIQRGLEPVERSRLEDIWSRRGQELTEGEKEALRSIYMELGDAPQTEDNVNIAIDAAARRSVNVDVQGGRSGQGETLDMAGVAFEVRLELPDEMLAYLRDAMLPETGKGLSEVLTNSFGIRGLNTFLGHYRANDVISVVEEAVGAFAAERGLTIRRLGTMKYVIEGGTTEMVGQLHEAINTALEMDGMRLRVSGRPETAEIAAGTTGASALAEVSNGHVVERRTGEGAPPGGVERRAEPGRVNETDWDGQVLLYTNANALIGAMAIGNDSALRTLLGDDGYARLGPVIELVRQHREIRNLDDLVFALRDEGIGGPDGRALEGAFRKYIVDTSETFQASLEAIAPRPQAEAPAAAAQPAAQSSRAARRAARESRRGRYTADERLERMRRTEEPAYEQPEGETRPRVSLGGRQYERTWEGAWLDVDTGAEATAELSRFLETAASFEAATPAERQAAAQTQAEARAAPATGEVELAAGQLYGLASVGAYLDEAGRVVFGSMETAHSAANALFDASHGPGGRTRFPICMEDQLRLAEMGIYFDENGSIHRTTIQQARQTIDVRLAEQYRETARLRSLADAGIVEINGVQMRPQGGSEEAHLMLDEGRVPRVEDLPSIAPAGRVRLGRTSSETTRGGGPPRITDGQVEAFIASVDEAMARRLTIFGDMGTYFFEVNNRMQELGYTPEMLAHPGPDMLTTLRSVQREVARGILERNAARDAAAAAAPQAAPQPAPRPVEAEAARRPAEAEAPARPEEAAPPEAQAQRETAPGPARGERAADRAFARLVGREGAQELAGLGITPAAEQNGSLRIVMPEGLEGRTFFELDYQSPSGRKTLRVEFPEQATGEPEHIYQYRIKQSVLDAVLAEREAVLARNAPQASEGARRLHLIAMDEQAPASSQLGYGTSNERAVASELLSDADYMAAMERGDAQAAVAVAERYHSLVQGAESARPETARGAYVDTVQGARQVIAMGDLHGDAYGLADQFLRSGVLIDTRPDLPPSDRSVPPAQRYRLNPDLPPGTQIVFTGDYIDRGPTSIEAVDLVRQMQADAAFIGSQVHTLRGNHEALFLRFVEAYRNASTEFVQGLVSGANRDALSDTCGWYRIGIDTTLDSIIQHYGSWEAFIAQNFDSAGNVRPGSLMEFINGTRAAVIVDNNYFTHGGPVIGTAENPIRSVQDLDAHFQRLFSTTDNAWADTTPYGIQMAMYAGDYSVAYVETHGWGSVMEGQAGREWMDAMGIDHIYVGHERQDNGVLRVNDHVTNLDVAMSESYGRGEGFVVIDPLRREGYVRVESSRSAENAPDTFGRPEEGYSPQDFANGRSRQQALDNGLASMAEDVFGGVPHEEPGVVRPPAEPEGPAPAAPVAREAPAAAAVAAREAPAAAPEAALQLPENLDRLVSDMLQPYSYDEIYIDRSADRPNVVALIERIGTDKMSAVLRTIEGLTGNEASTARANLATMLQLAESNSDVARFLESASEAEIQLVAQGGNQLPALLNQKGYFSILATDAPASMLGRVAAIDDAGVRDILTGALAMREFTIQRERYASMPQEASVRPLEDFMANQDEGLAFLWTFGLDPRVHDSFMWNREDTLRRAELYYDIQEFRGSWAAELSSAFPGREAQVLAFIDRTFAAVTRQDVSDTNLPFTPHGWAHSMEVLRIARDMFRGSPALRDSLIAHYGSEEKALAALEITALLHDIGYGDLQPSESKGLHGERGANMFETGFAQGVASMFGLDESSPEIMDITFAIDRHGEDKPPAPGSAAASRYAPASESDHPLLFAVRLADNLDMTTGRMRDIQTDPVMLQALEEMYRAGQGRNDPQSPYRQLPNEDTAAWRARVLDPIRERYVGTYDEPGPLMEGKSLEDMALASSLLQNLNESTWPHFVGCERVLNFSFAEAQDGRLVVRLDIEGEARAGMAYEKDATVDAALYQVYRADKAADSLTYNGTTVAFHYAETNTVYIEGVALDAAVLEGGEVARISYHRIAAGGELQATGTEGAVSTVPISAESPPPQPRLEVVESGRGAQPGAPAQQPQAAPEQVTPAARDDAHIAELAQLQVGGRAPWEVARGDGRPAVLDDVLGVYQQAYSRAGLLYNDPRELIGRMDLIYVARDDAGNVVGFATFSQTAQGLRLGLAGAIPGNAQGTAAVRALLRGFSQMEGAYGNFSEAAGYILVNEMGVPIVPFEQAQRIMGGRRGVGASAVRDADALRGRLSPEEFASSPIVRQAMERTGKSSEEITFADLIDEAVLRRYIPDTEAARANCFALIQMMEGPDGRAQPTVIMKFMAGRPAAEAVPPQAPSQRAETAPTSGEAQIRASPRQIIGADIPDFIGSVRRQVEGIGPRDLRYAGAFERDGERIVKFQRSGEEIVIRAPEGHADMSPQELRAYYETRLVEELRGEGAAEPMRPDYGAEAEARQVQQQGGRGVEEEGPPGAERGTDEGTGGQGPAQYRGRGRPHGRRNQGGFSVDESVAENIRLAEEMLGYQDFAGAFEQYSHAVWLLEGRDPQRAATLTQSANDAKAAAMRDAEAKISEAAGLAGTDATAAANMYSSVASEFIQIGEYSRAVETYLLGASGLRESAPERAIETVENAGRAFMQAGRYDEVLRLYQEGANLLDLAPVAEMYGRLGSTFESLGYQARAAEAYILGAGVVRQSDPAKAAEMLADAGGILMLVGRQDEALNAYHDAAALMEPADAADMYGRMASEFERRGDSARAADAYILGAGIVRGSDPAKAAEILLKVGQIYARTGTPENAQSAYIEAARAYREAASAAGPSGEAEMLMRGGNAFVEAQQYTYALGMYADAVNLVRPNNPEQASEMLITVAVTWQAAASHAADSGQRAEFNGYAALSLRMAGDLVARQNPDRAAELYDLAGRAASGEAVQMPPGINPYRAESEARRFQQQGGRGMEEEGLPRGERPAGEAGPEARGRGGPARYWEPTVSGTEGRRTGPRTAGEEPIAAPPEAAGRQAPQETGRRLTSEERAAGYEALLDRAPAGSGELSYSNMRFGQARFDEAVALIMYAQDVHSGAKALEDVPPLERAVVQRMLSDQDYVNYIETGVRGAELFVALTEAAIAEDAARLIELPSRPEDPLDAFAYDFAYARARGEGRGEPNAEDFSFASVARHSLAGNEMAMSRVQSTELISRTEGGIEAVVRTEDGSQYTVRISGSGTRVVSASAETIIGLARPLPEADQALVDFLNATVTTGISEHFQEESTLVSQGDYDGAMRLLGRTDLDYAIADRFVSGVEPQDGIGRLFAHMAERELSVRGIERSDPIAVRELSDAILRNVMHEAERAIEAARTGRFSEVDIAIYHIAENRAAGQGRTELSHDDFLFAVLLIREAGPQFGEFIEQAMAGAAPAGGFRDVEGFADMAIAIADRMRQPVQSIGTDSFDIRDAKEKVFRLAALLWERGVGDPASLFMNADPSNQRSSALLDLFPLSTDERSFLRLSEAANDLISIIESLPEGPLSISRTVGKKAFTVEISGEAALRAILDYAMDDARRLPDQAARWTYIETLKRELGSMADPAARMQAFSRALGEVLISDKGEIGPMRLTDRRTPILAYTVGGTQGDTLTGFLGSRAAKRHIGRNINFRAAIELSEAIGNCRRTIQQISRGRGPDTEANIRARRDWLETVETLLRNIPQDQADDVMGRVAPMMTDVLRLLRDGRITPEQLSSICAELRGAATVDAFVAAYASAYNRIFAADLGLPDRFVAENSGLVVDLGAFRQNLGRLQSGADRFPGDEMGFAGNPRYSALNEFASHERISAFDESLPVMDAAIAARVAGPEAFRDFKFSEEFRSELARRYPAALQSGEAQGDALFALWREEGSVPGLDIAGTQYVMTETGTFDNLFYNARIRGQDTCQNPANGHFVVSGLVGTVELPWIKEIMIQSPDNPEIVIRRIVMMVAGENGPVLLVQPDYHRVGETEVPAMNDAMIDYLRQRYGPLGVEVRDIGEAEIRGGTAQNRGYETFASGRSPFFYADSNLYKFNVGPDTIAQNGLHTRTPGEPVVFPADWTGVVDVGGLFR